MFAQAAAAVTHSGINSPDAFAVIVAIVIAVFWRFLVKIGIVLLGIGIIVLVVGAASEISHILHA